MVDWTKDTKLQGENARAAQGRVLVQLIEALEMHVDEVGDESLSEQVLVVMQQYSPISCSNCMVEGHWADDCPRKVVNA